MDDLDIRMLTLLQNDGRITLSDLSKKLALARPSISERLKRLIEKGVIEGFSARVSPAAIGRNVLVFIQISELHVPVQEFEHVVTTNPAIIECHRVTGTVSHFLKAAVTDMPSLAALVDWLIPFGNINTSIVLSSPIPYSCIAPTNRE